MLIILLGSGGTEALAQIGSIISTVHLSRQLGFLALSRHLYSQLPNHLMPYLPRLLTLTILLLCNSQYCLSKVFEQNTLN